MFNIDLNASLWRIQFGNKTNDIISRKKSFQKRSKILMSSEFQRPKDLKVEHLKQCPTHKDTPIIIDQFDIAQPERQKYVLSSKFRILQDINSHLYVRIIFTHKKNPVRSYTVLRIVEYFLFSFECSSSLLYNSIAIKLKIGLLFSIFG